MEQAKCMGNENMVRRQELIYGNFPAAFKDYFRHKSQYQILVLYGICS